MANNRFLRLFFIINIFGCNLSIAKELLQPKYLIQFDIKTDCKDDIFLIKAATGLESGDYITEDDFKKSLAAIELTDHFRKIDGQFINNKQGAMIKITVESWPIIKKLNWYNDATKTIVKNNIKNLRIGMRPGNTKLNNWSNSLRTKLIESGYPEVKINYKRSHNDTQINIDVKLGNNAILNKITLSGDYFPFATDEIIKLSKLIPKTTVWSSIKEQEVQHNLLEELHKRNFFEANLNLQWNSINNTLNIKLDTGLKIDLILRGNYNKSHLAKDIKNLLSTHAYRPESLNEINRYILNYLNNKGYVNAKVWHDVTSQDINGLDKKKIINYNIYKGSQIYINNIKFVGNTIFQNVDLNKIISRLKTQMHTGRIRMSPIIVNRVKSKIKALYSNIGYTEVSIQHRLETINNTTELVFTIQEGSKCLIKWLKLELPTENFNNALSIEQCLSLIFSDNEIPIKDKNNNNIYYSNKPNLHNIYGLITIKNIDNKTIITLDINKPIPFVKNDLVRILTALRKKYLPQIGLIHPTIQLQLESTSYGIGAHITVPQQQMQFIKRLIIRGNDKTTSETILRASGLKIKQPLDLGLISETQSKLNQLNIFQYAQIYNIHNSEQQTLSAEHQNLQWHEGDLLLNIEEQVPFIITNSISYDPYGLQAGLGFTKFNIGGKGRILDIGIKTGDFENKKLRLIPIGRANNLNDKLFQQINISYVDPWITKKLFQENTFANITQYRAELYYQKKFQCPKYRLRLINSLQWTLLDKTILQLGHQWEVAKNNSYHQKSKLTISAPFVQIIQDNRDSQINPTSGTYFLIKTELANKLFLNNTKNDFFKIYTKHQQFWPLGHKANKGIVTFGFNAGIITPVDNSRKEIPYSEKFFISKLFGLRSMEGSTLSPNLYTDNCLIEQNDSENEKSRYYINSDGFISLNLEYQFPLFSKLIWGEIFTDSALGYKASIKHNFGTSIGCGIVFKQIGIPIKIEYITDIKHKNYTIATPTRHLLLSAGLQF